MTARVVFALTVLAIVVLALLLAVHVGRKAELEVESHGSEVGLVVPGPALEPTTTSTKPAPTTVPRRVVRSAPTLRTASAAPAVVDGSVWDRLAACESGGNWHINTGNGYYGGLQFALSSWRGVGGQGYPHQASREEQIHRAVLLKGSGPFSRHWPACSRKLGLG